MSKEERKLRKVRFGDEYGNVFECFSAPWWNLKEQLRWRRIPKDHKGKLEIRTWGVTLSLSVWVVQTAPKPVNEERKDNRHLSN